LTYLQGNTCPEISIATHLLACFCLDPKLSHEHQATTHLGRYLSHTKDRGIVHDLDKPMSLECFVYADCAGGWHTSPSADADNIMLPTGFVITFANCLIYLAFCLQTEIALSTAEAEYIVMSSASCEVIPLMTIMKE
jgi:hypothetical protein